jgi:AraC family transcriptional regulator
MLQDLDIDPARAGLRYEAIGYDPFIEQIAFAIHRELQRETSSGRLLVESLGQSLSAYLINSYSELPTRTARPAPPRAFDRRRMARVMEFIDAHIDQNFTVAELASVACMSPAHFARSFKATTGRAPHEFVSKARLERAKRLLADERQPVTDIALSSGFSSPSNFARAFRNATGTTPGHYRRQQTGLRQSED